MRILITGAAGFLGSHLCDKMINEGHQVVALDNLITGRLSNLKHLETEPHFTFINCNIAMPSPLPYQFDYILHFASPASPSKINPLGYVTLSQETISANTVGTIRCLEIAMRQGAKFLFASTSEIYGNPPESPQSEEYNGNVSCIGVRSVYDEAKRLGETITMDYHRKHEVDTRIVRIFNTYGQRMRDDGRAIPNFIRQALRGEPLTIYGDGEQTRSFCYITDQIEGIYSLMNSEINTPVNIGNPEEISILKLCELINEITGNIAGVKMDMSARVGNDPQRRVPSIDKAKTNLGWEPEVSLIEGLQLTIEHVRSKEQY